MTLFLLGLPFLSYADVAETCFATSSNARCHQPNMTLFRLSSTGCWAGLDWWNKNPLRLRKIAPIARTVIDTFLCITQVNLWFCLYCDGNYSDTNELVILPAFYILHLPAWVLLCLLCLCGPEFTAGIFLSHFMTNWNIQCAPLKILSVSR